MLHSRKVCLDDLNPHLLCVLCGGYFVDATTIIECLHSFCKTCIVRYLETSKYCPICDVQVHKTKPLQNIRSDQTLQDIVYKLVPGLFQKEMQLRRDFYAAHPEATAVSKEDAGEAKDNYYFYSADDQVSLSLEYAPTSISMREDSRKRYLRCPAAVTIAHLQKLLRAKHELSAEHRVDICHENGPPLNNTLSLMDVAYIFQWKRKGPMPLYYQIYERPTKRRKLDEENSVDQMTSVEHVSPVAIPVRNEELTSKPKSPIPESEDVPAPISSTVPTSIPPPRPEVESMVEKWKEVQLQISETGIMKVVTPTALGKETIISSGRIDSPQTTVSHKAEKQAVTNEVKSVTPESKTSPTSNQNTEVSDINGNKKEIKSPTPPITSSAVPVSVSISMSCSKPIVTFSSRKETADYSKEQKNMKSVSHPTSSASASGQTKEDKAEFSKPSNSREQKEAKKDPAPFVPIKSSPTPMLKKSSSSPVGYKTLKLPPKSWNPSVSRGSYMANHSSLSKSSPMPIAPKQEVEVTETSRPANVPAQSKPPRFFKERDRPRFLGNPVSGVKPMYQIQSDLPSKPNAAMSHGSTSMIKIDPKTLSPMTSSRSTASSQFHNNNHLSCNSVTSSTGTITTTTASSKFSSRNSTSVPPLPPILHPPPNPLLYSYPGLINSPLMRPPIIPHNAPQHFPPYPLHQSMFYGSPSSKFSHSLPAVQRVPANVHPHPPIPPITHVPTSTVTTAHRSDVLKINGETADQSAKKESTEKLEDVAKPLKNSIPPPVSNGSNIVNKMSNGSSSNNATNESSSKQTIKVKSVGSEKCTTNPEPSKSVPPALPAQNIL